MCPRHILLLRHNHASAGPPLPPHTPMTLAAPHALPVVFLCQDKCNEDTVEKQLFRALSTTKLVENLAAGDNYSRCGRTDRGVSALANVRSCLCVCLLRETSPHGVHGAG